MQLKSIIHQLHDQRLGYTFKDFDSKKIIDIVDEKIKVLKLGEQVADD